MNLNQGYLEQLIKVGVKPQKAKYASQNLSQKELELMGDIWPAWQTTLSQLTGENSLQEIFSQQSTHYSVDSKAKRLIDIIGALTGLLFTALITIPVAVILQIDSPGPIFYSQIRCGLKGKPFRIWKFRSMVVDADLQRHLIKNEAEGQVFKNENDSRITSFGKFLRCTSLDEFPQFWNVLRGEMSLVGTRPPTPDEVKNYQSHHYKRLLVKPGITGEWQVNGRSQIKSFEEIVQLDLNYQNKWSFLYDLKLILKTITVVLRGKGAY